MLFALLSLLACSRELPMPKPLEEKFFPGMAETGTQRDGCEYGPLGLYACKYDYEEEYQKDVYFRAVEERYDAPSGGAELLGEDAKKLLEGATCARQYEPQIKVWTGKNTVVIATWVRSCEYEFMRSKLVPDTGPTKIEAASSIIYINTAYAPAEFKALVSTEGPEL